MKRTVALLVLWLICCGLFGADLWRTKTAALDADFRASQLEFWLVMQQREIRRHNERYHGAVPQVGNPSQ